LARSLLLMALLMLVMSRRRFSLAIKPAGSSLPELIRKPVLKRFSAVCKSALVRPKIFCAISELTFVLMRLMRGTFRWLFRGRLAAHQLTGIRPVRRRHFAWMLLTSQPLTAAQTTESPMI
jgi:hypothetical protein